MASDNLNSFAIFLPVLKRNQQLEGELLIVILPLCLSKDDYLIYVGHNNEENITISVRDFSIASNLKNAGLKLPGMV